MRERLAPLISINSERNCAYVADAKRTTAAAIRQIAKALPVQADRTFLISHASWLEASASVACAQRIG